MSDPMLKVEDTVWRDDGRYYIPISFTQQIEGKSPIAMRVASDAFANLHDAQHFAAAVTGGN